MKYRESSLDDVVRNTWKIRTPLTEAELLVGMEQLNLVFGKPPDAEFNGAEKQEYPKWTDENRLGIWRGVLQHGNYGLRRNHALWAFLTLTKTEGSFKEIYQQLRRIERDAFLDLVRCFFYVNTPRYPPTHDDQEYWEYNSIRLSKDEIRLEDTLKKRDSICMFCWRTIGLTTALFFQPPSCLGLKVDTHPGNGIVLCLNCRGSLNRLDVSVDFDESIGNYFLVDAGDCVGLKHSHGNIVKYLIAIRTIAPSSRNSRYDAESENGKALVIFDDEMPDSLPSREILKRHKRAALIAQSAGLTEDSIAYWEMDEWDFSFDVIGERDSRDFDYRDKFQYIDRYENEEEWVGSDEGENEMEDSEVSDESESEMEESEDSDGNKSE